MKKLTTRQFRLYDLLVAVAKADPVRWVDKLEIADYLGNDYYTINTSKHAHDVCSTMNLDRITINNSLEVDKIILIKDNTFKIATEQEAIQLEEELYNQAMKLLERKSMLVAKRLRNNQGKVLSNQLNPIDDKSRAEKFHETFVEEN
ncbi:MAG: hypothetical protein WC927_05930 [Bacilli bacterium]|jgi:hypothetical protein